MRDYISEVEHLVPRIKNLKRITGKKANPNKTQHVQGIITQYSNGHYKISLYITKRVLTDDTIRDYNTVELLGNLAHELSHMLDMQHSPERMKLECAIMTQFMIKLARDGYISEEQEARDGLFYENYLE